MKHVNIIIYLLFPVFHVIAALMPVNAAFDDLGSGARPIAMAGAFTGIADDANTIHSNPAGLGQLSRPEMTALYGRMYMGLTDGSKIGNSYVGFVWPIKGGDLGSLGVSWMELELAGAYSENTFGISYARKIYSSFYAGATLKHMRTSFSSDIYTAIDPVFRSKGSGKSSFGVDVAAFYRLMPRYTFGLMLRNINEPDIGLSDKDIVPMQARIGMGYYRWSSVFGIDFARGDGNTLFAVGAEHWIRRRFAARAGFEIGSKSRKNLSAGLGGKFGSFQLDYAFTMPLSGISGTSGSHRFSFTAKFGTLKSARIRTPLEEMEASYDMDVEALRRELDGVLESARRSQEKASRSGRRIEELELQIKFEREKAKTAASAKSEPALPGRLPDSSTESLSSQVESLKAGFEKALLETQTFKKKIAELERKLKRKVKKTPTPRTLRARPEGIHILSDGTKIYTVQKGDTLESIAKKIYGKTAKWIDIYRANSARGAVRRSGEIVPGQSLVIP